MVEKEHIQCANVRDEISCQIWTTGEEQRLHILKSRKRGWPEIASVLGRTVDECKAKYYEKCPRVIERTTRFWTPEELQELHRMKGLNYPWEKIGSCLNRTADSCHAKYFFEIRRDTLEKEIERTNPLWAPEELQELRRMKGLNYPWKKIGLRLNRPAESCRAKYHIESRRDWTVENDVEKTSRFWAPEELQELHRMKDLNYPWKKIGLRLNRTVVSCQVKYSNETRGDWTIEEDIKLISKYRKEGKAQLDPKGKVRLQILERIVDAHWSPKQERILVDELNGGKLLRDIATKVGHSETTCEEHLYLLDVLDALPAREETEWTQNEIDHFRALWDTSYSKAHVSFHMGLKYGSCMKLFTKLPIARDIKRVGLIETEIAPDENNLISRPTVMETALQVHAPTEKENIRIADLLN